LRDIVDPLKDFGAGLVALTPQLPALGKDLVEKHGLNFDLLSDVGCNTFKSLGIDFKVPDDVKAIYGKFGIDLNAVNGDDSWVLPMPGRIVVDANGIVQYSEFDPDYTHRPEPEATLAAVKAL
jgi:peroxiredoxin